MLENYHFKVIFRHYKTLVTNRTIPIYFKTVYSGRDGMNSRKFGETDKSTYSFYPLNVSCNQI